MIWLRCEKNMTSEIYIILKGRVNSLLRKLEVFFGTSWNTKSENSLKFSCNVWFFLKIDFSPLVKFFIFSSVFLSKCWSQLFESPCLINSTVWIIYGSIFIVCYFSLLILFIWPCSGIFGNFLLSEKSWIVSSGIFSERIHFVLRQTLNMLGPSLFLDCPHPPSVCHFQCLIWEPGVFPRATFPWRSLNSNFLFPCLREIAQISV
jgi:hypothetical protein